MTQAAILQVLGGGPKTPADLRNALPKHSGPMPVRPYVAPKAIRRPGSLDASKLPSVAAGRRYYPDDRQ